MTRKKQDLVTQDKIMPNHEEYKKNAKTMIICKNCTAKLFNQTVQDEEVVIAEKEM